MRDYAEDGTREQHRSESERKNNITAKRGKAQRQRQKSDSYAASVITLAIAIVFLRMLDAGTVCVAINLLIDR